MDIITLIVGIGLILLAMSLAFAIWGKVVEEAYDFLERLFGKNIVGWISIIVFFVVTIAIVIDVVRP